MYLVLKSKHTKSISPSNIKNYFVSLLKLLFNKFATVNYNLMTTNKQQVLVRCIHIQQQKVDKLSSMVDTLNDSAINSDKCVVGDKHHTFRAQTQNEQELYVKQLNLAINELNTLRLISKEKKFNKGELGALLETTNGVYFLATSIGIEKIDNQDIMILSPISPIGNLLLNKTKGDKITFRGSEIKIINIE